MKGKNPVRVGIDMDGVVARHDLGGFWISLRKMKEEIKKRVITGKYYYPSNPLEKLVWILINSKKKPFDDKKRVLQRIKRKRIVELFLVTGRFAFMEKHTHDWLKKYHLNEYFSRIFINDQDIDPKVFKANIVKDYKLDIFIEDDIETIEHLKITTQAFLFWIPPGFKSLKENRGDRITIASDLGSVLDAILKEKLSQS